jgi:serine/threonine protein kinase/tetratricopeptide (TPR) repeat protein
MTPERWGQLEELYQAARALPPSQRTALLERADSELRAEVASLLAQEDIPGNDAFLDGPAWEGRESLLKHDNPLPAETPFSVGEQVGPYRVEQKIGQGGMGEVWKARDMRLNRLVALKILKAEHAGRFKREARAVASLNHPNVCQLYDVGPDYLVLEYVAGKPLKGPLSIEETVRLAIQIASALEEAHNRGVLHRDLKPGNIMVTAAGAAKVLDFGLAKMQYPLFSGDTFSTLIMTEPGAAAGTPAYMSPEQAEGRHLDARSDIFSFGSVLYAMVSGREPFSGETLFATLSALIKEEPPPLRAPPELQSIVVRCLAKQPVDRFQNMAEVRGALQQIVLEADKRDEEPSIAVLPFANMSGEKEQEYFSDGLAEEIINSLAQLPGLKVTARTSAFAFRGKEQDIIKIAGELRVRTILEGSVRKAGNRIRVTAQLINAADGYHLWSQRYDRDLEDVFAVQDEIATAIAGALQVKLSVPPAALRSYRPKLPAYEAFLRARHQSMKFTSESLARCKEYLDQAIALDPGFALPHCDLAWYFRNLGLLGEMPAHAATPKARAAARRALEIDSSLPEAHAILGLAAAEYDYDWKEAGREMSLATLQDPLSPMVRTLYSFYLAGVGRAGEAVQQMERALGDDPVNTECCFVLSMCRCLAGLYEEAVAGFLQTQELDGNYPGACGWLAFCYVSRGLFAEALPCVEKWHQLLPGHLDSTGFLAGLLERAGQGKRAQELLQQLLPEEGAVGRFHFHLLNGNIDEAADWLAKAIGERNPGLVYYVRSPMVKALRESPRWPALAKTMNLSESVP